MSFLDRIRGFFSGRRNPALRQLEDFAAHRKGVEGYVEPRTATQSTTLLLVDREGDHVRAPVRSPHDAALFCERRGIPVYDAQVVGYPRRMQQRHADDEPDIDAEIAELERRLAQRDEDIPND